jgi:hypothetical protein
MFRDMIRHRQRGSATVRHSDDRIESAVARERAEIIEMMRREEDEEMQVMREGRVSRAEFESAWDVTETLIELIKERGSIRSEEDIRREERERIVEMLKEHAAKLDEASRGVPLATFTLKRMAQSELLDAVDAILATEEEQTNDGT